MVCANAHRHYRCEPVVTMRGTSVFTRDLARVSKLRSPCDPRDGVETGAFDGRQRSTATDPYLRWRNALLLDRHPRHNLMSRMLTASEVQLLKHFELTPASSGRKLNCVVVRTMGCYSLVRSCPRAIPDVTIR